MFIVLTLVSRLKFMDLLAGFITGHLHWCGIIPFGTLSQEAGKWLERSFLMLPFSWHNSKCMDFIGSEFWDITDCLERVLHGGGAEMPFGLPDFNQSEGRPDDYENPKVRISSIFL